MSTIYDVIITWTQSNPQSALLSFSIGRNISNIFKIRIPSSKTIDCLHGMRVISMMWVLYGHTFIMFIMTSTINRKNIYDFLLKPESLLVTTAFISVDTFLFISGFLVTWMGLKNVDKMKGKLNVFKLYIHRYIRLTPMLAIIILFTITLLKFCSSGPKWNSALNSQSYPCERYWWKNLLYIQNYGREPKVNYLEQYL